MIPSVSCGSLSLRASASAAPVGLRPCRLGPKLRTVLVRSSEGEDLYIGFPKNDYDRSAGRKGRVIKDDPSKYPSRNEIVGGWAGGEAGLWQFRDQIKEELATKKDAAPATVKPDGKPVPGKKPQYLGFGKDELLIKNTGVKGRVVYDDDDKYPNKEDVGPLSGATGGFAGGELGVKSFAATGEVKLRQPGQPGGQGVSPLSIIFLLLGAGGTGAALYFNGFFSGTAESGFTAESVMKAATSAAQSATTAATSVATGEQTDKTPILIGAGVIGGLAALTAAKIAFDSVKDQLREGASKALVLGAFATVVLLTAKAVIED